MRTELQKGIKASLIFGFVDFSFSIIRGGGLESDAREI